MAGRPTDYTDEIAQTAWDYIDTFSTEHSHAIPSVVGLCKVINRARSTVYKWAGEEDKQFSDILEALKERQEMELANSGLTGTFNPTITKLILTKHGYSDKQDLTSSDGTMSPKRGFNDFYEDGDS